MDYGRSDRADALAAGYVLGSLRGGARRRFEALLPAHPRLRAATRAWQDRLLPLSAALAPVEPSPEVWRRISARLGGSTVAEAEERGTWQRLSFWRGLAGFASVAALVLAAVVANPGAAPPPVIVVLAATGAGGVPGTSIVASISGDGASLVARPIVPVAVRSDRSLELWVVPTQGAPRSLGLLAAGSSTVALRRKALAGGDTLAVSLEPAGGSPTGAPTGPVVYAGKFAL